MTTLKDRLQADLTAAMKARDELRTATIRMVLTAVKNEEVAGGEARQLSDAELVRVLQREAKKRREAAEAYDAAKRPELATRERAEGAIVDEYLPAQLTDDELTALVAAGIAAVAATGAQQLGAVMKVVTPQVAGRADGARVSTEVRRQLTL
ncbi:MAG: GatB/YqeY domain-containing protein [Mycobacteriales bacterium]|nr:GatB/YqeY domain-containing protein [Frankia sp.]